MSREIPLTKGYVTIVDDEDYERLSQRNWHVTITQQCIPYAVRKNSRREGQRRNIPMHREIMDAPQGMDVDHINRDSLDNRKCNLRIVDRRTNLMNTGVRKVNTSGYKGVSHHAGRWRARIRAGEGRRLSLGYYDTPEDAARAYDNAARKMGIVHGLNFP